MKAEAGVLIEITWRYLVYYCIHFVYPAVHIFILEYILHRIGIPGKLLSGPDATDVCKIRNKNQK